MSGTLLQHFVADAVIDWKIDIDLWNLHIAHDPGTGRIQYVEIACFCGVFTGMNIAGVQRFVVGNGILQYLADFRILYFVKLLFIFNLNLRSLFFAEVVGNDGVGCRQDTQQHNQNKHNDQDYSDIPRHLATSFPP